MTSAVLLYDELLNAKDERERARVLAQFLESLEQRFPELNDMATNRQLSETELRLIKEIEQVRAELSKEIEQVRAELAETELKLTKEIEQVRLEVQKTRAELLKWSFLFWISQFGALLFIFWRLTTLS